MTCQGRSSSSAARVSCSTTGFSTDDPKELCIGANRLRLQSDVWRHPRQPPRGCPLMKIRLSQSKCGSTVDRALRLRDERFLDAFHFRGAGGRLVIVATQVKETVGDVETQLPVQRRTETASLTFRGLGADEYFSVLKRDDVGGTAFVEKPSMDRRHPPV